MRSRRERFAQRVAEANAELSGDRRRRAPTLDELTEAVTAVAQARSSTTKAAARKQLRKALSSLYDALGLRGQR